MSKLACVAACLLVATLAHAGEPSDCPPLPNVAAELQRLRTLLCASDVAALEKHFDQRHREYEAGLIDGEQLLWSYDALGQPFPYERLSAWLKRYPTSYPAHVAAARELIERGLKVRGEDYAHKVPAKDFAAMDALLQRAESYLARSLELGNKKPYPTYTALIWSGRYTHKTEHPDALVPIPVLKEYLDKAIQVDRQAFAARLAYMIVLQPRWHGSIEAMLRHYDESTGAGLSPAQLGRLRLVALYEQQKLIDVDRDPDARLNLAVEINRLRENSHNLREVIWLKMRTRRYAEALPDMNRALELNPEDDWVRSRRANALFSLERHAEAYKDFLVAARKGDAFAQNKVGWYLMMGVGVPQNKREGAQWFARSAAGGNKDGINNLKQAKAEGSI